jgi:DNA-binding PadR family transcriptional regulator
VVERDLLSGLIRLHILHHAAHEPIFGLGIIEELGRHGYKLSAGTLYPILHSLEESGYLVSNTELVDGRQRRLYVMTDAGNEMLALAKTKVWELFRELFEDELQFRTTEHADARRPRRLRGKSEARTKPAARQPRHKKRR